LFVGLGAKPTEVGTSTSCRNIYVRFFKNIHMLRS